MREDKEIQEQPSQIPGPVLVNIVGVKDTAPCPKCHGRGRTRTFAPLIWLAISLAGFLACLVWIVLAFTDLQRGRHFERFVYALVYVFFVGPYLMYVLVSRAVLRREGWSEQCFHCRGTGRIGG